MGNVVLDGVGFLCSSLGRVFGVYFVYVYI